MESQTRAEKVAPQLSYMLFIWLNFCLVKLASFGVKIRASKTMKKQSQVSPHCLPWNRTLQLQVAWFGVKDEAEENPMEFRSFIGIPWLRGRMECHFLMKDCVCVWYLSHWTYDQWAIILWNIVHFLKILFSWRTGLQGFAFKLNSDYFNIR